MKITGKISDFMCEEHNKLVTILDEFRSLRDMDKIKKKTIFRAFRNNLQKHIIWEEEILFPIFESKTGMNEFGPTAIMRMEHKHVKDLLEDINNKILKKDLNGIGRRCIELVDLISTHNYKEENILFPWLDETLDDKDRKGIFERMKIQKDNFIYT